MTTNVNPDPHAEGFQAQPTNNVTAIIDRLDDVSSAIRSLQQAGFSDTDVAVFVGREGLAKLDVDGERHGLVGRVIRAVESVAADHPPNKDAEVALKEGHAYITVSTDGSDLKKEAAERALKAHNAHCIRYVGRLAVERL
jgi:hypothetical protein